jgi:putative nucleotidyltransferase with HDIG domain
MKSVSLQVRLTVLSITALATILVANSAWYVRWDQWQQLLIFFGLIILASSVRISDPRGRSITPSTVLTYLAMYIFNPPTTLLVIGAGRTIGYALSRGWVPWRAIANGAQAGLSAAIGAVAFDLLGGAPLAPGEARSYLAALVGALSQQAANNLFVALILSRWRGTRLATTWFSDFRELFWPNLLSVPTAFVLALLYRGLHYVVALAYLTILPFQWRALRLYVTRRRLYAQVVDGLVVATDVNFPLSRGHARRVADVAVAIARELRMSESAVESVQFAALLHDVGMIGKDDLLDRPVLTEEDLRELQQHVLVGAEIARELPRKDIAEAILRHHEKYDGTGYPGGLQGEAIPLGARIIALAEVVDSMAAGIHPFISVSSFPAIVSHVHTEGGRAFDPDIVDAFVRAVERGNVLLEPSAAVTKPPAGDSDSGEAPTG